VLDGIAELLVVVSQTVNAEMSVERLVRDHSRTREQLMRHKKDTVVTGQHLLDRLAVPVLVQDGYVFMGHDLTLWLCRVLDCCV